MILSRMGNKRRIAEKIIKHFPDHTTYLEPFFGAGGMFFSKEKAKYNIVNDQDSEVFNLFEVISNRMKDLEDLVNRVPISEELFNYWRKNNEQDPVRKAMRFLMLSNFSFLCKGQTFMFNNKNKMAQIYERIASCNSALFGVEFANCDFRNFLPRISSRGGKELKSWLIYCDPPYIGTGNNYEGTWVKKDTEDLFQQMVECKAKFALSEFDSPIILDLAKHYDLNLIEIGERQNIGNRRTEILITNF